MAACSPRTIARCAAPSSFWSCALRSLRTHLPHSTVSCLTIASRDTGAAPPCSASPPGVFFGVSGSSSRYAYRALGAGSTASRTISQHRRARRGESDRLLSCRHAEPAAQQPLLAVVVSQSAGASSSGASPPRRWSNDACSAGALVVTRAGVAKVPGIVAHEGDEDVQMAGREGHQ
jgi:hypothetical protein